MITRSSFSPADLVEHDVATDVRKLVAQQLGLNTKRVLDEARFLKDLGADWLDRLELVIEVEDRFGIEIADAVVDQLKSVGDLIQFVESCPRHVGHGARTQPESASRIDK